jgi:hypothetical protein
MGSSTVIVDGEPTSYAALPALSCQDIGLPAPLRRNKKGGSKSLFLPTPIVMPIPSGPLVLIGGTPTISMPSPDAMLGPAAALFGKALRKAHRLSGPLRHLLDRKGRASSQYLHKVADTVFDKLKVSKNSAARNKRAAPSARPRVTRSMSLAASVHRLRGPGAAGSAPI